MSFFNRFFNLFHRKHRFTPQYTTFSFLKKLIFFGTTGFIFSLAASKFFFSKLIFSFEPSQENRYYVKLNPALERGSYYPNMLMLLGIFQRIYAKFREEEPYLRMEEQQFQQSTLYWVSIHDKAYHFSAKKKENLPLVLVIAGSEGVNNTVRHVLLASYELGYRVIALDLKDWYDLDHLDKIVKNLQAKYPKASMLGVGVEYGANLMINFAAKNPSVFKGMVSIGNPFDLVKSELNIQSRWIWRELYSSMLKGKLKKAELVNKNLSKDEKCSLFQLDKFTYGIDDKDYKSWKENNSCINWIKDITVPTLLLQSKEDPFTQEINDERFQNEKCIFVTTQRGGHNEWFENIWMSRWFVSPVKSFLKLVHEKKVEKIQERNQQAKTIDEHNLE